MMALWVMTALSTIATSILTGVLLVHNHRQSIRGQLEAYAASLMTLGISDFSQLEDFTQLNLFIEDALQMERVDKIVRIYDHTGKAIFATTDLDSDEFPNQLEKLVEKPTFFSIEENWKKFEGLIVPYFVKGNKKAFYLQVLIPLPAYSEIFKKFWWEYLILLMAFVGLSLLVSRRLSKKLMKPVAAIADHIQTMDPNCIEEWRPINFKEQGLYLEEIIHGINKLTQKTRSAVLQIRKMSRYVAHEMRTPLTILQGEAEMVLSKKDAAKEDYAATLKSSLEEIQRMSETVTTILQVEQSPKTFLISQPVSFNLAEWIQENKAGWEKTLGRPIDVRLPREGAARPCVDPKLLYHLVANLIRNIRNHAPVESPCIISTVLSSNTVSLQLKDDGPGLQEKLLNSLNSEEGTPEEAGIGLSLCRQIADICKIKLRFSNRPDGGLLVDIMMSKFVGN